MEISLSCSDPAIATIGDCEVEIPADRLVEFAAKARVVYSPPRGNRMIVDYNGDMFEFQYRHQVTDVWEDLPKDLWDVRVLRHRKRIILRAHSERRDEENLPGDVAGTVTNASSNPADEPNQPVGSMPPGDSSGLTPSEV